MHALAVKVAVQEDVLGVVQHVVATAQTCVKRLVRILVEQLVLEVV